MEPHIFPQGLTMIPEEGFQKIYDKHKPTRPQKITNKPLLVSNYELTCELVGEMELVKTKLAILEKENFDLRQDFEDYKNLVNDFFVLSRGSNEHRKNHTNERTNFTKSENFG